MDKYPSNSHKKKEEIKETIEVTESTSKERGIEKVTINEVVEVQPTIRSTFKNIFSGEHLNGIGHFVLASVIVPAFKSMVYDSAIKGLERAMWGEDKSPSRSSSGPINYSTISTTRAAGRPIRDEQSPNTELRFASRVEGDAVLDNLSALIETYGSASVADYYELVGKTGSFTDNKWGWVSMRGSRVIPLRGGGFTIELPKAKPL